MGSGAGKVALVALLFGAFGAAKWVLGGLGSTRPSTDATPPNERSTTDYAYISYRWGKWVCFASLAVAAVAGFIALVS